MLSPGSSDSKSSPAAPNLSDLMQDFKAAVRMFLCEDLREPIRVNISLLYQAINQLHHDDLSAHEIINHQQTYDALILSFDGFLQKQNEKKELSSEQISLTKHLAHIVSLAKQIMVIESPQLQYAIRIDKIDLLMKGSVFNFDLKRVKDAFNFVFKTSIHNVSMVYKRLSSSDFKEKIEALKDEVRGEKKAFLALKAMKKNRQKTLDPEDKNGSEEIVNLDKKMRILGDSINDSDAVIFAAKEFHRLCYLIDQELSALKTVTNSREVFKLTENINKNLLFIASFIASLNKLKIIHVATASFKQENEKWLSLLADKNALLPLRTIIDKSFTQLMLSAAGEYIQGARQMYSRDNTAEMTGPRNFLGELLSHPGVPMEVKANARIHWQAMKRASEAEVLAMLLSEAQFKRLHITLKGTAQAIMSPDEKKEGVVRLYDHSFAFHGRPGTGEVVKEEEIKPDVVKMKPK